MNTKRTLHSGLLLGVFLLFGCNQYHSVTYTPERLPRQQDSWDNLMEYLHLIRPEVRVIQGEKTYLLKSADFARQENGKVILSGTLVAVEPIASPRPRSFNPKKLSPDQMNLLRVMYLIIAEEVDEGSFSYELAAIEQVSYYKGSQADGGGMGLTVGLAGGTAVIVFVVLPIVALALIVVAIGDALNSISCNCPQVYSESPGEPYFEGSLLPGAISKSLQRTDLLPLMGLDLNQEVLSIWVRNELPEVEYLDQLELLKLALPEGYRLGTAANDALFAYRGRLAPVEAIDQAGQTIVPLLTPDDPEAYDFSELQSEDQLNSIVLSFDRTELQKDQVQLVIRGQQTQWLEQTADAFFAQFGTRFDRWQKRMDKVPPTKYEEHMAQTGMSLNAYVHTPGGWQAVGTFQYAGTRKEKVMGLPLDLSQVVGDTVQIKLETAYRFWELSEVGLSEDWHSIETYESVPWLSATNEKGEEVLSLINAKDKAYAVQALAGTEINLRFANTVSANEVYVLSGTGYYHHQRDYDYPPNRKVLKAMKKEQLTVQEFSILLDQLQKTGALAKP